MKDMKDIKDIANELRILITTQKGYDEATKIMKSIDDFLAKDNTVAERVVRIKHKFHTTEFADRKELREDMQWLIDTIIDLNNKVEGQNELKEQNDKQ